MQIRKRLSLNSAILATASLVVTFMLLAGLYRINNAFQESDIADKILNNLLQQSVLTSDYLRTGNERARQQLIAEHQQAEKFLGVASGRFRNAEDKKIIGSLIGDHESAVELFSGIVENREMAESRKISAALSRHIEDRLLTQLNIRSYYKNLNIQRLRASAGRRFLAELRLTGGSIAVFIIIFVAMAAISSWRMGRFIVDRIDRLQNGSSIIAEGSLDHRIDIKGNDEFAQLSRSFDAMTEKLNISHLKLENEITEHKQTQEYLYKAHDELELRVKERTRELEEANESLRHETNERRQIEEQLIRSQKLEALGTLAGGIAHDFNNILAGIIGFTEMVLEDIEPDSPEHRRLELALGAAYRGRDLVKQILVFSRQSEQDKKPLALTQIIDETLKLLRPAFPSTIEIVWKNPIDDGRILADPVRMHQILMNLCTNAAHAMRQNGGVLELGVSRAVVVEGTPTPVAEMVPGEYVVLNVSDTGCGMEPEILERIFDPFFTTKREGEGTGLGLAVAYGIVKNHGGYVAVESKPGKGSTFRVYLPRVKAIRDVEGIEAPSSAGGDERILIVDDEGTLVELNRQRLMRLGYDVVATTSSMEALHIFREGPDAFDLVITDQTMPNLTGMDLATELLKVRSDIPIILCTGHSDAVSPDSIQKAGIKALLMKPVDKRGIAEAVRRALGPNRKE